MFKSRSESNNANVSAPSVEDLRRQARHRLIGASVLVLVAVVGFPMVFDTEPRPIAVDVPIHIPAQPVLAPLSAPTPATAPALALATEEPAAPQGEVLAPKPTPAAKSEPATNKPPAKVAEPTGERFVVQVGAYAEQASARAVRLKIERAGLKTYTQVASTAEGRRIRVRLGPFNTRAEAEKAAEKIKSLGYAPGILTL
jgi:DedD protein